MTVAGTQNGVILATDDLIAGYLPEVAASPR